MASIEEVYQKVVASDEERAAFAEAAQTQEGLASFLADRGCEATPEEVAAFLKAKQGELSDAELEGVAGGCSDSTGFAPMVSIMTVAVGCIAYAF